MTDVAFAPQAPGVGRLVTAMVTPFTVDGTLDLDGAQKLADHLVSTGTDTVLVHGTTGESPTLAGEEPWQLLHAVRDAVGDRGTVMLGTGSNDTAHAVRNTAHATEVGVDAVLVVVPYYNRPDQRGLLRHFTAVADATDRPIVLYDVPSRTVARFTVETLAELAQIEHVVGIKDATTDLGHVGDVLNATAGVPGGFAVWSGADEVNLPLLSLGATGAISVASHLVGRQIAEMIRVFATDPARAAALHLACLPVHRLLFAEPSPAPLKGALAARGLPAGPVRLPLVDASEALVERLLAAVDAADRATHEPSGGSV